MKGNTSRSKLDQKLELTMAEAIVLAGFLKCITEERALTTVGPKERHIAEALLRRL